MAAAGAMIIMLNNRRRERKRKQKKKEKEEREREKANKSPRSFDSSFDSFDTSISFDTNANSRIGSTREGNTNELLFYMFGVSLLVSVIIAVWMRNRGARRRREVQVNSMRMEDDKIDGLLGYTSDSAVWSIQSNTEKEANIFDIGN